MIKVDFGNHVSGQSSALVEFGNMVANLKSAKTATTTAERNEYFKQASVGWATRCPRGSMLC